MARAAGTSARETPAWGPLSTTSRTATRAALRRGPGGVKDGVRDNGARACAIVPALDAAATAGGSRRRPRSATLHLGVVVDDGSKDATAAVARDHGAFVIVHGHNLGKGAAIRSGLREAARRGMRVAVTVDADGQHPAHSAREVLEASDDVRALVLGVRDLVRDGAPRSNQFGNAVSNFFLSRFGRPPGQGQGVWPAPLPGRRGAGARGERRRLRVRRRGHPPRARRGSPARRGPRRRRLPGARGLAHALPARRRSRPDHPHGRAHRGRTATAGGVRGRR